MGVFSQLLCNMNTIWKWNAIWITYNKVLMSDWKVFERFLMKRKARLHSHVIFIFIVILRRIHNDWKKQWIMRRNNFLEVQELKISLCNVTKYCFYHNDREDTSHGHSRKGMQQNLEYCGETISLPYIIYGLKKSHWIY